MTELVTVRQRQRGGYVVHRTECRVLARVHATSLTTIPSTSVQQLSPRTRRCTSPAAETRSGISPVRPDAAPCVNSRTPTEAENHHAVADQRGHPHCRGPQFTMAQA